MVPCPPVGAGPDKPKDLPAPAGKRKGVQGCALRAGGAAPKGSAALRAAGTKKKDTTYVVSFFLVEISGIEPLTS